MSSTTKGKPALSGKPRRPKLEAHEEPDDDEMTPGAWAPEEDSEYSEDVGLANKKTAGHFAALAAKMDAIDARLDAIDTRLGKLAQMIRGG